MKYCVSTTEKCIKQRSIDATTEMQSKLQPKYIMSAGEKKMRND